MVGDSIKERKKYGNEEESQEDKASIQDDFDGPGPEEGPGQEESHQEGRAEEESHQEEVSISAATVAHEGLCASTSEQPLVDNRSLTLNHQRERPKNTWINLAAFAKGWAAIPFLFLFDSCLAPSLWNDPRLW